MYSNNTCKVQPKTGFNAHGEPQFGAWVNEACTVVRLNPRMEHTTVRADGSMSRGHGDEAVMTCRLMLAPATSARIGSKVEIVSGVLTLRFKVTSMEPKYDVLGPIDHYAVEGEQCP